MQLLAQYLPDMAFKPLQVHNTCKEDFYERVSLIITPYTFSKKDFVIKFLW